jgi:hypothetical protein
MVICNNQQTSIMIRHLEEAHPRDLFVQFLKDTKPVERSKLLPGDIGRRTCPICQK